MTLETLRHRYPDVPDKVLKKATKICLELEICIDCFWDWQNGELKIEQAFHFSKN